MAPARGFEPRSRESESRVFPTKRNRNGSRGVSRTLVVSSKGSRPTVERPGYIFKLIAFTHLPHSTYLSSGKSDLS